jgi:hypothetical protein
MLEVMEERDVLDQSHRDWCSDVCIDLAKEIKQFVHQAEHTPAGVVTEKFILRRLEEIISENWDLSNDRDQVETLLSFLRAAQSRKIIHAIKLSETWLEEDFKAVSKVKVSTKYLMLMQDLKLNFGECRGT